MYGPRKRIIGTRYVQNMNCSLPGGASCSGSAVLLVLECGHISVCGAHHDYRSETHDQCSECRDIEAGKIAPNWSLAPFGG